MPLSFTFPYGKNLSLGSCALHLARDGRISFVRHELAGDPRRSFPNAIDNDIVIRPTRGEDAGFLEYRTSLYPCRRSCDRCGQRYDATRAEQCTSGRQEEGIYSQLQIAFQRARKIRNVSPLVTCVTAEGILFSHIYTLMM